MNYSRTPVKKLVPVMLVTSATFLLLAVVTRLLGTDYGLDTKTANFLALVFLFVAAADAFASVFLHRHGGTPQVRIDRHSVNAANRILARSFDREALDRAEDEGMISR